MGLVVTPRCELDVQTERAFSFFVVGTFFLVMLSQGVGIGLLNSTGGTICSPGALALCDGYHLTVKLFVMGQQVLGAFENFSICAYQTVILKFTGFIILSQHSALCFPVLCEILLCLPFPVSTLKANKSPVIVFAAQIVAMKVHTVFVSLPEASNASVALEWLG